jgi:hypothetical protein
MNISDQRAAVARLTSYCERIIERGKLPALDEMNLRYFVNETCTAFDMAPVQDRISSNVEAA